MRLKIDWVIAYSWKEIYHFCFFYFIFEGNFQVQAPAGAHTRRGDLTEGLLRYTFRGLTFGGAYTWRAYFRNFVVINAGIRASDGHSD